MTPLYITSQALAFAGISVEIVGRVMKNKRYIMFFTLVAGLFYTSSYICLQTPLPALVNGTNILRNIVYIVLNGKDKPTKSYIAPMAMSVAAVTVYVGVFWSSPLDLFMIVSMTAVAVGFAFKNLVVVRICMMTDSAVWVVYNIMIEGYVNMACDALKFIAVLAVTIYAAVAAYKAKKRAATSPVIKSEQSSPSLDIVKNT